MDKYKTKILLVEDDPNLSMVLQDFLEMLGYEVVLCADGDDGIKAYRKQQFDMCILDIMMPKKDGFTVAAEIRQSNTAIPIIFLTAKSLKEDRIRGFQTGCDDYITKPFSTEELSLRIKAILKRCMVKSLTSNEGEDGFFKFGKFTFDYQNMILISENERLTLTRKEAELLKVLCLHKNKVLTREVALKTVWGDDDYFIGRSMDVFITKLRKYLKDDPSVNIINIHGTGFKFLVD
jgi:DNA-binding response OmpR family regulator